MHNGRISGERSHKGGNYQCEEKANAIPLRIRLRRTVQRDPRGV
jgi:hypothetical protein